ncbi:UNVERIFIED_CONTAM: hypothetical protein PYX00_005180 [Menopon gallinae]
MKEFITRVTIEKKTEEILSEMSQKFYTVIELCDTDLEYVNEFINSDKYSYYYIVDYLIRLNGAEKPTSLTIKYYGNKLLKYIKQNHLSQVWLDLIRLEEKYQTLEKSAIFIADWFQTDDESVEDMVIQHLDSAADLVKKFLKVQYKDHPLNSVSEETFIKWKNENISGNMFESHHCKQIINCISHVLLNQLQYYFTPYLDTEICYTIDSAISERRTTPLILGVIYESVARRLGIRCEIIFFPAHNLLRWKEEYGNENSPYHYIDMSGEEMFLSPECCSRNALVISQCPMKKPRFQYSNMKQVAEKAAHDILNTERMENGINHISDASILELLLLFSPMNIEWYRQLGRYYMRKEMNVIGLIKKMRAISPESLPREAQKMYEPILSALDVYFKNWEESKSNMVKVKRRTKQIEFAVGMIGRHKIYDYTCVVYGWDPLCQASQDWIISNGVLDLPHKDQQPFYNVLAHDGTERYVAQENLQIIHSPPLICHPEIGHFFEEYCITYYKPNKQLQDEYPEDASALEKLLRRHTTE